MTQRKSARATKRMILMRMCYRSEGFTGGANASPFFCVGGNVGVGTTSPKGVVSFFRLQKQTL